MGKATELIRELDEQKDPKAVKSLDTWIKHLDGMLKDVKADSGIPKKSMGVLVNAVASARDDLVSERDSYK